MHHEHRKDDRIKAFRMMKRATVLLLIVFALSLSSIGILQGAAPAGERPAPARGEEGPDRLSVPNEQHQGHRGDHPSEGRRQTGRTRIGNTLSR